MQKRAGLFPDVVIIRDKRGLFVGYGFYVGGVLFPFYDPPLPVAPPKPEAKKLLEAELDINSRVLCPHCGGRQTETRAPRIVKSNNCGKEYQVILRNSKRGVVRARWWGEREVSCPICFADVSAPEKNIVACYNCGQRIQPV